MVEDLPRGVEGEDEEHSDEVVLDWEFGKLELKGIFSFVIQAYKHTLQWLNKGTLQR